MSDSEEDLYQAKAIVGYRKLPGIEDQYLVQWQPIPGVELEDTWVPENHGAITETLLNAFRSSKKAGSRAPSVSVKGKSRQGSAVPSRSSSVSSARPARTSLTADSALDRRKRGPSRNPTDQSSEDDQDRVELIRRPRKKRRLVQETSSSSESDSPEAFVQVDMNINVEDNNHPQLSSPFGEVPVQPFFPTSTLFADKPPQPRYELHIDDQNDEVASALPQKSKTKKSKRTALDAGSDEIVPNSTGSGKNDSPYTLKLQVQEKELNDPVEMIPDSEEDDDYISGGGVPLSPSRSNFTNVYRPTSPVPLPLRPVPLIKASVFQDLEANGATSNSLLQETTSPIQSSDSRQLAHFSLSRIKSVAQSTAARTTSDSDRGPRKPSEALNQYPKPPNRQLPNLQSNDQSEQHSKEAREFEAYLPQSSLSKALADLDRIYSPRDGHIAPDAEDSLVLEMATHQTGQLSPVMFLNNLDHPHESFHRDIERLSSLKVDMPTHKSFDKYMHKNINLTSQLGNISATEVLSLIREKNRDLKRSQTIQLVDKCQMLPEIVRRNVIDFLSHPPDVVAGSEAPCLSFAIAKVIQDQKTDSPISIVLLVLYPSQATYALCLYPNHLTNVPSERQALQLPSMQHHEPTEQALSPVTLPLSEVLPKDRIDANPERTNSDSTPEIFETLAVQEKQTQEEAEDSQRNYKPHQAKEMAVAAMKAIADRPNVPDFILNQSPNASVPVDFNPNDDAEHTPSMLPSATQFVSDSQARDPASVYVAQDATRIDEFGEQVAEQSTNIIVDKNDGRLERLLYWRRWFQTLYDVRRFMEEDERGEEPRRIPFDVLLKELIADLMKGAIQEDTAKQLIAEHKRLSGVLQGQRAREKQLKARVALLQESEAKLRLTDSADTKAWTETKALKKQLEAAHDDTKRLRIQLTKGLEQKDKLIQASERKHKSQMELANRRRDVANFQLAAATSNRTVERAAKAFQLEKDNMQLKSKVQELKGRLHEKDQALEEQSHNQSVLLSQKETEEFDCEWEGCDEIVESREALRYHLLAIHSDM